jgi:hypothetical protein
MLQLSSHTGARNLEWSCEAISSMAEPCDSAATAHCGICGRWFCAVHDEDENWHICVVEPGEEGGEAAITACAACEHESCSDPLDRNARKGLARQCSPLLRRICLAVGSRGRLCGSGLFQVV